MKKTILLLINLLFLITTACASPVTKNKHGETNMKIKIDITSDSGKHTLTAILENNSSGAAFYELLKKGPVTVDMHDYGSFEKVGSLPKSLPRNDKQITTTAGDIILYQGNQITIYYDKSSWNFTKLGEVISTGSSTPITQDELKKILGKGDITAVFKLECAE